MAFAGNWRNRNKKDLIHGWFLLSGLSRHAIHLYMQFSWFCFMIEKTFSNTATQFWELTPLPIWLVCLSVRMTASCAFWHLSWCTISQWWVLFGSLFLHTPGPSVSNPWAALGITLLGKWFIFTVLHGQFLLPGLSAFLPWNRWGSHFL